MPDTKTKNNLWVTLGLIAAIVVLFIFSLMVGNTKFSEGEEGFGGTDGAATEIIEEENKDYKPWFDNLFAPAGEIESGLFAMQAALGAGLLGYSIGWYRGKSKYRGESEKS